MRSAVQSAELLVADSIEAACPRPVTLLTWLAAEADSRDGFVAAPDGDGAVFEGRLRELGGGFCGTRLRLLSEPLDLSAADGLYLDAEADADAARRVFKVALRTRQDRGEVERL